ncbi:myocardin isoform X5 [Astyanax mexicanus]|uniref:myocardin isoform X5 n=1 Tax=Astyanax mexicanus TaxID=7994 RepID=UPI0020CADF7D|nr:myocardin isoform X5 [Astyanax mexicanus]
MNAVKSAEQRPELIHGCRNTGNPNGQAGSRPTPNTHRKNVLQLRLQQRRTREQLADQGIMPPLKSPAAFHEQRKSLERSKTGDYLKHKIRSRPEKSELVNMRILQDSASDGSAQDPQTKLKRARLADDLNEKIALRPGPLELVEKNIIPVDSTVKEAALKVNHGKFPKQEDSYAFEEDSSSESLSPEQPLSDESQSSAGPLAEPKSSVPSPSLTSPVQGPQTRETPIQNPDESAHNQAAPPIPVPAIIKQSKTSDKNRHKKPKDIKPKVKKLKYHQYIPPDQKAEKSPPPMDSAYARLLQQQQLFLQLQILSQQKHQQQTHHQHQHQPPCPQNQSFSYQPLHQHPPNKQTNEQQHTPCSSSGGTSTASSSSSSPVKNTYCSQSSVTPVRPGPLPANLDDLKVSELRQQLRIRGLPVSGTKTALIERLRPYKDPSSSSPSSSGDITTVTFPVTPTGSLSSYQSPSSSSAMSHVGGYYPFCSTSSTPPISPASSELSVSGSLPDSFSDVTMSSPQFGLQPSPAQLSADESQNLAAGLSGGCLHGDAPPGLEAEKDKMLVEKQKVIEELTWKLHQEQRQVEELRMQLHKRKHSHGLQDPQGGPRLPPQHQLHLQSPGLMQQQHFFGGVSIKQEHVTSSCPMSSKSLKTGSPNSCMEGVGHCGMSGGLRNLDVPSSRSPSGLTAYLSPQCSPQDSPVTKNSSSPQPSSLPPSPSHQYLLTPPLSRDTCSHPLPHSGARPHPMQLQQKNVAQSVSCSYAPDQRSMQPVYPSNAENNLNPRGSSKAKSTNMQHKMAILHSPRHVDQKCAASTTAFCSSDSASAIKQPPCYEDAVKQQMARSQQMDELLDVLIESGVSPSSAGQTPIPKFHRHYSHMSPSQMPYDHAAGHGDYHLEVLLSNPMSRLTDIIQLKMGTEEGQLEEVSEGFPVHHHHSDKLLNNRDMMDTPLSPMATKVSPVPVDGQGLGMTFTESPWETMEWLDLTPPSSATAFNSSMPPPGPSIFNTEFLDVTDINLNSAMDLHLDHW